MKPVLYIELWWYRRDLIQRWQKRVTTIFEVQLVTCDEIVPDSCGEERVVRSYPPYKEKVPVDKIESEPEKVGVPEVSWTPDSLIGRLGIP